MSKIIEVPIDLGAAFLSSSGVSHPERAVDASPITAASFGPPDALDEVWTPVVNANPIPGATHSAYFAVTPTTLAPRFLEVVWGYDTFVKRIRLKASGPGLDNASVSLLSGLGFIEQGEVGEPPLIPIPLPPFPGEDGFYSVEFDLPLYALGVAVHPDAQFTDAELASFAPGDYPQLLLSQLDVYENVGESNTAMSIPQATKKRSRAGVSEVLIYPHNDGDGPFDATTVEKLLGLGQLGISKNPKVAIVEGGETVHPIDAFETGRTTKITVTSARCSLRAMAVLMGGTFAVDPSGVGVGEVQYLAEELGDRLPFFRLKAKSTTGNGTDSFVYFKCKVDGDVSYDLEKDKVTDLKFSFMLYYDETAVRQDGNTGGVSEWLYGSKGETVRHS